MATERQTNEGFRHQHALFVPRKWLLGKISALQLHQCSAARSAAVIAAAAGDLITSTEAQIEALRTGGEPPSSLDLIVQNPIVGAEQDLSSFRGSMKD
jgi:hypothetical protein